MKHRLPRIAAVVIGGLLFLGGMGWSAAGAGMYGSPLVGMGLEELVPVWAFLLLGPFSALPAAILAVRQPLVGGSWLFFAGIASGAVALSFLMTDAGALPLIVVSVPMIFLGQWLKRTARAPVS